MTVDNNFGFVDYGQPGTIEPIPTLDETKKRYSSGPSVSTSDLRSYKYTDKSRPATSNMKLWGKNGYYMNGPYIDPFDYAGSISNQIASYTQSFTNTAQQNYVTNFGKLINKYGNTNSPGVLWAMAANGMNPESEMGKLLMKNDASVSTQNYAQSAPVVAGAPAATNDVGFMDNFWSMVETPFRNTFAALEMPLQGIQGTYRGIGGELTKEGAPWFDMQSGRLSGVAAELGSFFVPPISLWADRVRGDNNFTNPWEQSTMGQTLLSASGGAGMEAFTKEQYGLDLQKSADQLLLDPAYDAIQGTPEFEDAVIKNAQENGYYANGGWFVDETSNVGRALERSGFDAWAIPGPDNQLTAWTLGRGITSAVAGPDWAGYGVASGFIDAVSSVLGDPVTYIPGGAISKVAKGISGGKILFGKALKESNAAYGLTLQQADVARGIVNANRARREAAGLPTEPQINPSDDMALKSIEELAGIIQEAKIAQATTEATSSVAADTTYAATQMRDLRRATTEEYHLNEVLLTDTKTSRGAAAVTVSRDLWKEHLDLYKAGPDGEMVLDSKDLNAWTKTLMSDPVRAAEWDKIVREQAKLTLDGVLDNNKYQGASQYLDILDQRIGLSVKRGKDIPAAQVETDVARLYASTDAAADEGMLSTLTYSGAVLTQAPAPNAGVLSTVNGIPSIAYWSGTAGPKMVGATEVVPVKIKTTVINALTEFLDRPGMSGTNVLYDTSNAESMASQVLNNINVATSPARLLTTLLGRTDVTYGQILKLAQSIGIEGYLDDVLRKVKIDGIDGLDVRTGRGTWMGNHPKLIAYKTGDDAKATGESLSLDGNLEEELALLDTSGAVQVATDLRALPVRDVQHMGLEAGAKKNTLSQTYSNFVADSVFNALRREQSLNSEVDDIRKAFEDPATVLRRNLAYTIGMKNTKNGSIMLDAKGVREFIFGSGPASYLANRTLDVLATFIPKADIEKALDAGKYADNLGTLTEEYDRVLVKAVGGLILITKGKWDPETYISIAENAINGGGREGLLNILAPRLGFDITAGSIAKTTKLARGDGGQYFRTWRTTHPHVARALGQRPTARKINLQNSDEIVETILLYGRYGKLDESTLSSLVGRVAVDSGTLKSVGVNRMALARTFDALSDKMLTTIQESGTASVLFAGKRGLARKTEISNAIRASTRLWLGGMTDENKLIDDLVSTNSDVARVINSDGESIEMPSIQLDTELAQGFLGMPSVDEWGSALNRFTLAVNRIGFVGSVAKVAKNFFDNFFRASLLAFKAAYVIRNIGEMQVRAFLNGHQSMLSDPFTMAGMVMGNAWSARRVRKTASEYVEASALLKVELGRDPKSAEVLERIGVKSNVLDRMFAPYKDTILGTSWEVGTDEKLAIANHVEQYFSLIRQAHSLTDPRVYNAAIRQGWQPVGYGTPNFNKGWAHELIMLERSGLARLVVSGPPAGFQSKIVNAGTVGTDLKELSVSWLMSDDKGAVNVRALMVGADPKWAQIFSDPVALRETLFDHPTNSIAARVNQFTRNDPRLNEYIATGSLPYGVNEKLLVKNITDTDQRIRQMAGVLQEYFNDDNWATHFADNKVKVPWLDQLPKKGTGAFDLFFKVANRIERIGAVGPEFRLAYWDRIAELAPGLNASEIDRALKAARTTLSPIKRLSDGNLDSIGRNHPAFTALNKAKDTNSDGMLTLQEIHDMASDYAAAEVAGLFYDAAKRNQTWNALRLVFPFGQAWGNTMSKWAELGAKNPIQVYKAAKVFNALTQTGSSAIYEAGSAMGAFGPYGQYAPGFAPWDQDTNGGFFYTDEYGGTSFVFPYVGRLLAGAVNFNALLHGKENPNISDVPIQSPASSINLAMGADSIAPGVAPLAAIPLSTGILPDHAITASLRSIAMPFGEKNILESMVVAWFAKMIGGAGALPFVGDAIGGYIDVLAPANKNKNLSAAMMILSTSGNYDLTDPDSARKFRDDAEGLAKALLLTTGLIQSVLPSNPVVTPAVDLSGDPVQGEKEVENTALYTIGMLNTLFQQYRERNGYDDTAAREEFVKDFGPAVLFATTGDWVNFSRVPTSQALEWARQNPDIALAYMDEFTLFFPNGDASDVAATDWIKQYGKGDRLRKNKDVLFSEITGMLETVQKARINFLESSKFITADEAAEARDDLQARYIETADNTGTFFDRTAEMDALNIFVNKTKPIQESQAGQAFVRAWQFRQQALDSAASQTGNDKITLGGVKVAPIKDWLIARVNELEVQYPDFRLLASRFRKEWD